MSIFDSKFWIDKLNLKTLDVYIIKQMFTSSMLILFVLLGIAWLSQIIRLIEFFFTYKLSFFSFLKFSSFLLPQMISIVLPLCMLIAVLFVFIRLVNDRELIVMKSVGMNSKQLSKSVVILSLSMLVFLLFLNSFIQPYSARSFRQFRYSFINDLSRVAIKEKTFNEVVQGVTAYIDHSKGNNLYDIFINDYRDKSNNKIIYAEKGQIIKTKEGFSIMFLNGSLHQEREGGKAYDFGTFDYYNVSLGQLKEKQAVFKKPKEIYTHDLFNTENLDFVNDKNKGRYIMEGHKRILMAFFVIIFPFIAMAFILRANFNRMGNIRPVIYSSVSCILYYFAYVSLAQWFANYYNYAWVMYLITAISIYIPYRVISKE